jgi:hypothetical protein
MLVAATDRVEAHGVPWYRLLVDGVVLLSLTVMAVLFVR